MTHRAPRDSDPLSVHLDHAWELVAEGDLDGALASAEKSLEIDAGSPEAHNLLGYILAAGGRPREALGHYERAIELDATFLEAMLNAAEAAVQLGDLEAALRYTDDAHDLAATPDEKADALLLRVDALLAAGHATEAAHVVAELPEGPFQTTELGFHVGRALFETGHTEEAAIRIEQAAAERPLDPGVQYYLGLVREALGDVRGATVAFLQSRDLDLSSERPAWAEDVPRFERRLQRALKQLPEDAKSALEGALVLVDELPGAEVVSEGVDPRQPILADDLKLADGTWLRRCFVYQRNLERLAASPDQLDALLVPLILEELEHAFGPKPPEDDSTH